VYAGVVVGKVGVLSSVWEERRIVNGFGLRSCGEWFGMRS
jgi:hypothetical protein